MLSRRRFLTQAGLAGAGAILLPRLARAAALKPRWAPPELTNAITVTVVEGKNSYGTFPPDQDVLVVMPTYTRTQPVAIYGARNVRLIGGALAPRGISGSKYALRFASTSGSICIEGVFIDGAAEPMDGIAAYGKVGTAPDLTIQNCRIVNIRGTYEGVHGDIVQAQGPLGTVRIDGLTGSTDYQGLFIPNQYGIRAAELSRINLSALLTPSTGKWTHQLWLADGCENSYPITLQDVWCQPRPGQHLGQSVYPRSEPRADCAPVLSADRLTLSWPEGTGITGQVRAGTPPAGDFVPEGVAGIDYRPVGYGGAPGS